MKRRSQKTPQVSSLSDNSVLTAGFQGLAETANNTVDTFRGAKDIFRTMRTNAAPPQNNQMQRQLPAHIQQKSWFKNLSDKNRKNFIADYWRARQGEARNQQLRRHHAASKDPYMILRGNNWGASY